MDGNWSEITEDSNIRKNDNTAVKTNASVAVPVMIPNGLYAGDEALIKAVKAHRNLYDSSDHRYRDKVYKENTWAYLEKKLNIRKGNGYSRWKTLRDKYVREKKNAKLKSESSDEPPSTVQWSLAPLMAFLDCHIKSKKLRSLNGSASMDEYVDYTFPTIENDPVEAVIIQENSNSTEPLELSESLPMTKNAVVENNRKRKSDESFNIDIVDILKTTKEMKEMADDPNKLFGLMVGSTLKKLSPRAAAKCKCKIATILYEAEFGED